MGLKGYRLWVMGQLDSTCRAPALWINWILELYGPSPPTLTAVGAGTDQRPPTPPGPEVAPAAAAPTLLPKCDGSHAARQGSYHLLTIVHFIKPQYKLVYLLLLLNQHTLMQHTLMQQLSLTSSDKSEHVIV
jgi:hypothetical protein